jgi:hypothetical protein
VLVGAPAGVKRELPLGLRLGTLPVLWWVAHVLMKRPTREGVRGFYKQILVAHPERLEDDFLDLVAAPWLDQPDRVIEAIEAALGT